MTHPQIPTPEPPPARNIIVSKPPQAFPNTRLRRGAQVVLYLTFGSSLSGIMAMGWTVALYL